MTRKDAARHMVVPRYLSGTDQIVTDQSSVSIDLEIIML